MIFYSITHLIYKRELYQYLILNNKNFYLSSVGWKSVFYKLGLGVKIENVIELSDLNNSVQVLKIGFGLTNENNLPGSVLYCQPIV